MGRRFDRWLKLEQKNVEAGFENETTFMLWSSRLSLQLY